jgi:ankyrin repeat protein
MDLLVEYGADVNILFEDLPGVPCTAIIQLAVYRGYLKIVDFLFVHGVDPSIIDGADSNIIDDADQHPISYAVYSGHDSITKLFLDNGAALNLPAGTLRNIWSHSWLAAKRTTSAIEISIPSRGID